MTKVEPSDVPTDPLPKLTLAVKVCTVLSCLGLLLVVIPSGLDMWLEYTLVVPNIGYKNQYRVGIFYACSDIEGCETDDDSINQWQWDAAYIYGTSIITIVVTVVALVIYCLKYQNPWGVFVKYVGAVAAFLSWIFVFASDFLMVSNRNNVSPLLPEFDIEYGLILSICGGVLFLLVTVLLTVDVFCLTPSNWANW